MHPLQLGEHQIALVQRPLTTTIFLEGPAGTGKTTAAAQRLLRLLHEGTPAGQVLVLVPQRTLAEPYEAILRRPELEVGGMAGVMTLGGLAQRMVDLFWPVIAGPAGFANPDLPPTFLTLETAQYYMARLVRPLLDKGYFATVTIDPNRLFSQILDNLNKAAVVGFGHTEIAARLRAASTGDASQMRTYEDAQACANSFREYCLAHNLLDFSLQYEIFSRRLWPMPVCRDYLLRSYTHLIVDNVEEDTPVAHDILREWLPACRSALLVYDHEAGYRRFLGADAGSAATLRDLCRERQLFTTSHVTSPALRSLAQRIGRELGRGEPQRGAGQRRADSPGKPLELCDVLSFQGHRYHPQMIVWVGEEIARLVHEEGVPPGEIAVLAPFLPGALRFSLSRVLQGQGIPARSHRPSRTLGEEPAAQCLLVLARLAHITWDRMPPRRDVACALSHAIADLDPVRGQILAGAAYAPGNGSLPLKPFDEIGHAAQERVTYRLGGRYETLRDWLAAYVDGPPAELDHFWSRLFGEVLAQPGFGYHQDLDGGQVAAHLIESAHKFRRSGGAAPDFVQIVDDGVIAAQHVGGWQLPAEEAVLLAPAHTFLLANRAVDYQFWLDIGSPSWWERLNQPLTHPYVLSRAWPPGNLWTDRHEFAARQDALYCLVSGLIRRCRRKIYLAMSEVGEQGIEQSGPLLQVLQQILQEGRRVPATSEAARGS